MSEVGEGARQDRRAARRWLRVLDVCLHVLEDASERGETAVSPLLAARLGVYVPGLRPGMPVTEALDQVFEQQQLVMLGCAAPDVMTVAQARDLTERIKSGVGQVSLLLLEAHERRAWAVLGYPTWEIYVRQEFGLSRTRSYELVYHGQVIREIQAATGMSGIPNISPYVALQIRGHIEEVKGALRARVSSAGSEAEAATIVVEVVKHLRAKFARRPARDQSQASPEVRVADPDAGLLDDHGQPLDPVDRRRLLDTLGYLAGMPPANEVVAQLDAADEETSVLASRAARWLTEFSEMWATRRHEAARLLGSPAS